MLHFLDRVVVGLHTLLGVGLIAAVVLGGWNVAARYMFGDALLWADEAAVFYMIVMTFLGALVCGWRSTEIRMNLLVETLPSRWLETVTAVQNAAMAGMLGWVAWLSWRYVARVFAFGMTSDALGLPMWPWHATVTFSFAGLSLIAGVRFAAAVYALAARHRRS